MRVLVTGATGLLGNNVVRTLLENGDAVRVLVREHHDPRPLAGLDVESALGDVRDATAVYRACAGVDAVIHAAGSWWIGWRGFEEVRAINVLGTENVAVAAREAGAKMIYVSTVNALGLGKPNQPANEKTPLGGNVLCTYVVTKREAEQRVLQEVSRGLHGVIVNPGFMLGPWDWKPSSGKMLISLAKQYVPLAPKGGCSLCDSRDVAAGILAALSRGQVGQRYILAGHNLLYLDLWRLFAKVTGQRPPLMRLGPMQRWTIGGWVRLTEGLRRQEPEVNSAMLRMSDQFHYYDSGRAMRELGYQVRTADTIVTDSWNWLREFQLA